MRLLEPLCITPFIESAGFRFANVLFKMSKALVCNENCQGQIKKYRKSTNSSQILKNISLLRLFQDNPPWDFSSLTKSHCIRCVE